MLILFVVCSSLTIGPEPLVPGALAARVVSSGAREGLGISSWAGWKPGQVSREDCPELHSVPLILGWNKLEPQPEHYEFDEYVGDPLRTAAADDLYVTLMIWVRPGTPTWLFDRGVPRVYTDREVDPLGKKMSKERRHCLIFLSW